MGIFEAKKCPGPGSYDIPTTIPDVSPTSTFVKDGSYSIGGRPPTPKGLRNRRNGGGPGSHHPKFGFVERRHAGHGFARQRRLVDESSCRANTPAASLAQGDNLSYKRAPCHSFGTTDLKTCWTEEHIMSGGFQRKAAGKSPAPGVYNPDDRCTSRMPCTPAYSATPRREENSLARKALEPGPGSYKVVDDQQLLSTRVAIPSVPFSTSARDHEQADGGRGARKTSVPGPGRYVVANKTRTGHSALGLGGSSPGWTMAGRGGFDLHSAYV